MRKTTDTFSFDLPDDWQTFRDGIRLVAQGAKGEELILSSWYVKVSDGASAAAADVVVDRLFANAQQSAQKTAADPELKITRPFTKDVDAGGHFPCWTVLAETIAGDVFFGEA